MTTTRWSLVGVLLVQSPYLVQWAWWHLRHRCWPKANDTAWLIAGAWTWGWVFAHFG